jgi:hypothetical protein
MSLSPILFDPDEAADLLHCSRRWLLAKLRSGEYPGRKIAKRWVLAQDDINSILEMSVIVPAAAPQINSDYKTPATPPL